MTCQSSRRRQPFTIFQRLRRRKTDSIPQIYIIENAIKKHTKIIRIEAKMNVPKGISILTLSKMLRGPHKILHHLSSSFFVALYHAHNSAPPSEHIQVTYSSKKVATAKCSASVFDSAPLQRSCHPVDHIQA